MHRFGTSIYTYPLSSDFSSLQAGGPDLIQIPNNSGLYGEFTTRVVLPALVAGGTAGGYSSRMMPGCSSTAWRLHRSELFLALNFQFDEFISPPGWVRLLSSLISTMLNVHQANQPAYQWHTGILAIRDCRRMGLLQYHRFLPDDHRKKCQRSDHGVH